MVGLHAVERKNISKRKKNDVQNKSEFGWIKCENCAQTHSTAQTNARGPTINIESIRSSIWQLVVIGGTVICH